eukprot:jgi/Mesen1/6458/ME000033S05748
MMTLAVAPLQSCARALPHLPLALGPEASRATCSVKLVAPTSRLEGRGIPRKCSSIRFLGQLSTDTTCRMCGSTWNATSEASASGLYSHGGSQQPDIITRQGNAAGAYMGEVCIDSLRKNRRELYRSFDNRIWANRSTSSKTSFFGSSLVPSRDALHEHQLTFKRTQLRSALSPISATLVSGADPSTQVVQETQVSQDLSVSCTTFNILAPIYKRVRGEGIRESEFREVWLKRNNQILDMLIENGSTVLCLQEFWIGNEELVKLYDEKLRAEGYDTYKLARTNNRGDGLYTAVKRDAFEVVETRELLFNDCGDRVAQVLRLRSRHVGGAGQQWPVEFLVVNTHLLFPHNANSSLIRLRQSYKILEFLEQYKTESRLPPMPIVLCGDWNGSKRGQVYKFLRSQGFTSSYDIHREYKDHDAHCWVSHRNHHGNICGVDFIWLLNPSGEDHVLTADWKAAVFGMIKSKLSAAGLEEEEEAFNFFQSPEEVDGCITLNNFQLAMDQLGLTGDDSVGLTRKEIGELMQSVDTDGNGVIDYEEFKRIFSIESMEKTYSKIKEATGIQEGPWTDGSDELRRLEPTPVSSPLRKAPVVSIPSHLPVRELSPSALGVGKHIVGARAVMTGELAVEDRLQPGKYINLAVKRAHLYPPEMEEGRWPEHYSLSDHAPVTAVFSPLCM